MNKIKLLHQKARRTRRRHGIGLNKYPQPREIITALIILIIFLSSPLLIAFVKQKFNEFFPVDDDGDKPVDQYQELMMMNSTANRIEKKFQNEKRIIDRFMKMLEQNSSEKRFEKRKMFVKTKKKNDVLSLTARWTTKQFQIKFF